MKKILGMKLLSLVLAGVVAAGSIGAGGYVIYGDVYKRQVEPIERQIYTGSALMPELKVYASKQAQKNGEMLEVGKDYTVSYANNVKTGTGKAIITGLGRYGGNKTVTFVIQKKSLKADQKDIQVVLEEESLVYTGSTIKPKVLVLYGCLLYTSSGEPMW